MKYVSFDGDGLQTEPDRRAALGHSCRGHYLGSSLTTGCDYAKSKYEMSKVLLVFRSLSTCRYLGNIKTIARCHSLSEV